jgi:hypothetical protein
MAQPFDSTASVQTASSTQGSDGRVGPSPGTGSSSRPGAGGWLGYTASPLPGQGGSGLLVTATPSGAPVPPLSASAAQTGPAHAAAECTRAQLGQGTAQVGTPDAQGVVYGAFRVVNVSATNCSVSRPGTVVVVSAPDPTAVRVVPHSAGDGVSGLPSPPPSSAGPVLLAPGQSYLLRFAWVPASGGCAATASPSASASPSDQPSASASPTDSGSPGTSSNSGAAAGEGPMAAQARPQTVATTAPTLVLGHTPGAGGTPAASATIPDACAGTVYRTDPVAGQ